jgi:hypothetical protein
MRIVILVLAAILAILAIGCNGTTTKTGAMPSGHN